MKDSIQRRPLRDGDTFLAFMLGALILVLLILVSSLFDIHTPQDRALAGEVGFSFLFLLPMAAVFYWMFTAARDSDPTAIERFVDTHRWQVFGTSFLLLVLLVILDEFSAFSGFEVGLHVLIAIITFIVSILFIVSMPRSLQYSRVLFVAAAVFTLLAVLPYQNVIAAALRGEPLLWVLSLIPFVATSPAAFRQVIYIIRSRSDKRVSRT